MRDTLPAASERADARPPLLASYPKQRPPLSEGNRRIYEAEYQRNRAGQRGLARVVARLEGWMHRIVAEVGGGERVLEIGAGTLNHVRYERGRYSVYDVVEPFEELWRDRPESELVGGIYADVSEVPAENRYDRAISIAVLEHLVDLPLVVASAGLLLAEGGRFQAAVPSEGGFLWGAAWRLTTRIVYRLRTGEDYADLMRHEHVNRLDEIEQVVGWFFADVDVSRFPLPGRHASFYSFLDASSPRLERCRELVESRSRSEAASS